MHLDVFNDDAFSMMELTTAINKLPYQPKQIGALNLYASKPHTTNMFTVEEQHGKLSLIPAEARGSRPRTDSRVRRHIRPFQTVHLPQDHTVLADDVSGIRAFGSETEVEALSAVVNDVLERQKNNIEVTKEFQRISGIKGVIVDADGTTVIEDLFAAFGLTQSTADVDFAAAPEWKNYATAIQRAIEDALGADTFSGIQAVCGNAWWDSFVIDDEIKAAWDRWNDGQFLREDQLRVGFEFMNIKWYNYRGQVGDIKFVPDDECHFYPVGVRDLFEEHQAPAPFMETVNTRAKPYYSKQERLPLDFGVELFSCSDVLHICTRPKVLIKSTGTNVVNNPTPTVLVGGDSPSMEKRTQDLDVPAGKKPMPAAPKTPAAMKK